MLGALRKRKIEIREHSADLEPKRFSEWLLSPSLYPTDERLLSKIAEERQVPGFDGSVYRLNTDLCSYSFLCPRGGFLRGVWPRLKHQVLSLSRRSPVKLRGIRFLRTVGELPIWLDDEPKKLSLKTKIPRNAEFVCVVERRIVASSTLEESLESGISSSEINGLGELLASLGTLQVAPAKWEQVVTSLPSSDLPYLLMLRGEFARIAPAKPLYSEGSIKLMFNRFADGKSGWAVESLHEPSREELYYDLLQRFGPKLTDRLKHKVGEKISRRTVALIGYSKTLEEKKEANFNSGQALRLATREFLLGGLSKPFSVILASRSLRFGEELASLLEGEFIPYESSSDSSEILAEISPLSPAVVVVSKGDGLQMLELVKGLTQKGIKPVLIQEAGLEIGGILEISSASGPEDQTIQALRGISALLD